MSQQIEFDFFKARDGEFLLTASSNLGIERMSVAFNIKAEDAIKLGETILSEAKKDVSTC